MIKLENTEVLGWEAAIRGMRNPMNSWDKSDSIFFSPFATVGHDINGTTYDKDDGDFDYPEWFDWYRFNTNYGMEYFQLGPADYKLMMNLAKAGSVDAKYRRMIVVTVDITAPLYWWKEFDTYKVGTVANSCSTMHKIHSKEFTLDDFSHEHLFAMPDYNDVPDFEADEDIKQYKEKVDEAIKLMREEKEYVWPEKIESAAEREVNWHYNNGAYYAGVDCEDVYGDLAEWAEAKYALDALNTTIEALNCYREKFLETKDKRYWWQMIQLLPSSYNQRRTVMLNYEVLAGIYPKRKDHKLDEWHTFCNWIKGLPYSEFITLEES